MMIRTTFVVSLVLAISASAAPPPPGDYAGDKLRVSILSADGRSYSGTVSLGQQTFPLSARADGDALVGSFTSGRQAFNFTLAPDRDGLTFRTGQTSYALRPIAVQPAARNAPVPAANAKYVRMARVAVPDLLCKTTASTILIPSDWKLEGGVIWRQNVAYPTAVHARVFNPRGYEQMASYPSLLFNDGVRESAARNAQIAGPDAMRAAAAGFPEGSMYLGCEVRRIVADPVTVLKEYAIPRYRRDLAQARIVEAVDLPAVAKAKFEALGNPQGATVKAVRVRFAYDIDGVAMEEDFLCFWGASPVVPPIMGWGMEFQSFRAGKGKLDATMPLFHAINRSAQIDMKWYAGMLDVQAQMHRDGMNAIAEAGRLSKYIAARSNEVNQMISDGYWKAQQANDRIYDNISQSIRGTQRYTDPYNQRPLDLPNDYSHAYISPRGEIIMSNDPNFNPAIEFKEDWRELRRG